MSKEDGRMDEKQDEWIHLRFGVLGPVLVLLFLMAMWFYIWPGVSRYEYRGLGNVRIDRLTGRLYEVRAGDRIGERGLGFYVVPDREGPVVEPPPRAAAPVPAAESPVSKADEAK